MSQISSATSVDSIINGTPNRFNEMSSEDFIRIMFSELTNQDPLQPSDTGALLEQLNSIRSIESDVQLTNQLKSLVTENQLSAASNLIGKLVEGLSETLDRVQGTVISAAREGDEIKLQLDTGAIVPIENIETIVDPAIFAPPSAPVF